MAVRQVSAIALLMALTQYGCIVVGGYSNTGGWFLWPGGLGLVLIVALVFLLMRRR